MSEEVKLAEENAAQSQELANEAGGPKKIRDFYGFPIPLREVGERSKASRLDTTTDVQMPSVSLAKWRSPNNYLTRQRKLLSNTKMICPSADMAGQSRTSHGANHV